MAKIASSTPYFDLIAMLNCIISYVNKKNWPWFNIEDTFSELHQKTFYNLHHKYDMVH
jgi:hypothetical protein